MVRVELIFISISGKTFYKTLMVPVGATVSEVIDASGIVTLYPEIQDLPVGIFSEKVTLTTTVSEGDRIEIYRPLIASPKDKRRLRANKSTR
jgi:putative ubiquitin-RnfH superfamily antitoxin RatB of RatAB toxin-antitoxin module